MERLVYIDILKGIAIILVVMGHMFSPYKNYLDSSVNQIIYSVHMPLFFFLSGYVFRVDKEKHYLRRTITKRVLTLLLPFFCFSAVYCFVKDLSYYDLLFTDELHYGYWFILVLFEITIISMFLKYLIIVCGEGEMSKDLILNGIMILVLLIIAKMELIPEPYKSLFSIDKVAKFYMFFQIGKFINTYLRIRKVFYNGWTYTSSAFIYFVAFMLWGYDLQNVGINSFLLALCGIVVLTNMIEKNKELFNYKGILAWLGKHTLEIYLIHFFFLVHIPQNIINCNNIVYLQIILLLILSLCCIGISLTNSFLIQESEVLRFFLFGKGIYVKKILDKL